MSAKISRGDSRDSSNRDASAEARLAPDRSKLLPGLYIVATPIGNLGDMTARALDVLGAADVIACEDTRVTGGLLHRFAIRTPMLAYHEHNAARVRPLLLARLEKGERVALVSDAGTPLISDPGYKLVREVIALGIAVVPVPGASAVMAALTVAGLPTDRFLFAGFPPSKPGQRQKMLAGLRALDATLVFLESPQRLAAALADMAEILGPDRLAAVARELTKLHEEVQRGTLTELAAMLAMAPVRGEIVVVVGPPVPAVETAQSIDDLLRAALARMSVSEAAAHVAAATGAPKRKVYARALELAAGDDS